jgi:hypothetical protein
MRCLMLLSITSNLTLTKKLKKTLSTSADVVARFIFLKEVIETYHNDLATIHKR